MAALLVERINFFFPQNLNEKKKGSVLVDQHERRVVSYKPGLSCSKGA